MSNVLEIQNLKFAYDDKLVLDNLSLTIKKKQFVAILGENGAGKSTLLNLIMSKYRDYQGVIKLFGDDIKNKTHFKDIAYISQNAMIAYKDFPTTVNEVLSLHTRYLKKSNAVDSYLKMVGLESRSNYALNELSGGQLQRVALAIALIKEGDLIILDEPTSGIDKDFSHTLYGMLKSLSERGKTILMVTHNSDAATQYVDRMIKIDNKQCFDA